MLPGQHVAVVGRTGSGKSSLVMSLFRMLETVDGCVKIDGDDVAKLPLSTHRARLNIIPQVSKGDSSQIMFVCKVCTMSGRLELTLDGCVKIRTCNLIDF